MAAIAGEADIPRQNSSPHAVNTAFRTLHIIDVVLFPDIPCRFLFLLEVEAQIEKYLTVSPHISFYSVVRTGDVTQ